MQLYIQIDVTDSTSSSPSESAMCRQYQRYGRFSPVAGVVRLKCEQHAENTTD
jgi:hypothetical protein